MLRSTSPGSGERELWGTREERERRVKRSLLIQSAVTGVLGIIILRINPIAGLLVMLFALTAALFVRFYGGPWVRK